MSTSDTLAGKTVILNPNIPEGTVEMSLATWMSMQDFFLSNGPVMASKQEESKPLL